MLADRNVQPGLEIRRIKDDSGWNIHGARRSHPNGSNFAGPQAGFRDREANCFAHALEPECLPALGFGGKLDLAQHVTSAIDDASLHAAAADIQTNKFGLNTHKE